MDIGESTSYPLQDRLFPENLTGSIYYVDPGHSHTEVEFLDGQAPLRSTMQFESRDEMLYHIAKERIKENKSRWESREITTADRYRGFEDGLKAKIKGVWSRTMHIINAAWTSLRRRRSLKGFVSKGLINYDRELLGRAKTKAWINFSVKQVRDFIVRPDIQSLASKDLFKTHSIVQWHHNGESGYSFMNEKGDKEFLQNTVTSSNDRFAKGISMMRVHDDCFTGESIAYTGRGDTKSKAMEQLNYLFQEEMARGPAAQKGLVKTEAGYDFSFTVNNLMSSNQFLGMSITRLMGIDERESVLREKAIFDTLSKEPPITLTDKNGEQHSVTIKPLYFNQGFNSLASHALARTPWKQTEINNEGYALLFPLINNAIADNTSISPKDKDLLRSARDHLTNPSKLKAEQEFFYRDLVMKILKIPVINHCENSIDHTSLSNSISTALQSWRNLGYDIPVENPHGILEQPSFKEFYMANIHGVHQVTQASRSSEGKINGQQQLSHAHGFEWNGNSIALRMAPDRYVNKARTKFNLDSPLIRGRKLIKTKGMATFYTNSHPLIVKQEEEEKKMKQERQRRVQNIYLRAGAAAGA